MNDFVFMLGVNATCVSIPEVVKKKIIPLRCVKCEDNLWTFNGTLSVGAVKHCINAADNVGINALGLLASVTISLFLSYFSYSQVFGSKRGPIPGRTNLSFFSIQVTFFHLL